MSELKIHIIALQDTGYMYTTAEGKRAHGNYHIEQFTFGTGKADTLALLMDEGIKQHIIRDNKRVNVLNFGKGSGIAEFSFLAVRSSVFAFLPCVFRKLHVEWKNRLLLSFLTINHVLFRNCTQIQNIVTDCSFVTQLIMTQNPISVL